MGWLKGAYLRVERVLYDGLRARADARLAARARKHGQRPQPTHLITGERGEDAAFFYLRELGYTVVARRWRSDRLTSDLDLVAWDGPTLVFFEVKTRTARDLVPAEQQVDRGMGGRIGMMNVSRKHLRREPVCLCGWDFLRPVLAQSADQGRAA